MVLFFLIVLLLFFQSVHYEGTLADTGEVFDTTHEDNTIFSFELGKGSVIKAWDIAVKTMKVKQSMLLMSCNNLIKCFGLIFFPDFSTGWRNCKNNMQARLCIW
jgi:hypothetical protein